MSSGDSSRPAADRVWATLPANARSVLEEGLSPTDLQTLLLDLPGPGPLGSMPPG